MIFLAVLGGIFGYILMNFFRINLLVLILLFLIFIVAKFEIRVFKIMFLNYLPSGMITVLEITTIFGVLIGTILALLFTSDQANTRNLYLKKAK